MVSRPVRPGAKESRALHETWRRAGLPVPPVLNRLIFGTTPHWVESDGNSPLIVPSPRPSPEELTMPHKYDWTQ